MERRLILVALLAAAALIAEPSSAWSRQAAGPDAAAMALRTADMPAGSVVGTQGHDQTGLLPSTSIYSRNFAGVKYGTVRLITFTNTVMVAKRKADATTFLVDLDVFSQTAAARAKLLAQVKTAFANSSHLKITSSDFVRARSLHVGDDSIEFLFSFGTTSGTFQVGEIYIRVDRAVGLVYYGVGEQSVPKTQIKALAAKLASRMKAAL